MVSCMLLRARFSHRGALPAICRDYDREVDVPAAAKQTGLVALMVLGGLMLWFGNPVIWLWIGSQMSETQRASMGPYAVVAIGIIASTIARRPGRWRASIAATRR